MPQNEVTCTFIHSHEDNHPLPGYILLPVANWFPEWYEDGHGHDSAFRYTQWAGEFGYLRPGG